jgi:hypothetical protein
VCDKETTKSRRLKPVTGLWKIQTQWVVTPEKQTTNIFSEKGEEYLSVLRNPKIENKSKCVTT